MNLHEGWASPCLFRAQKKLFSFFSKKERLRRFVQLLVVSTHKSGFGWLRISLDDPELEISSVAISGFLDVLRSFAVGAFYIAL